MSDLNVPPELIDLHPMLARMVKVTGATVLTAAGYDAWAGQAGNAMVVFTKDPDRFNETLDLAAVVPELQATAGGNLRLGLLPPAASRAIAPRYGFTHWPVFVLLRDGQYLGAVEGIRDWDVYTSELLRMLAADPPAPPATDASVKP